MSERLRSLGLVLLSLLLWPSFQFAAKRRPRPPGPAERAYARELDAALSWLRANTSESAVVLAPWPLADAVRPVRPVVAVAAPRAGEADEQAARWKDVARFFFADDEAEAHAAALRWGATVALVEKPFPGRLCRAAGRCEYASPDGARLNALGLRRTLAGRMSQGASFDRFEKTFDSPRFAVYLERNAPLPRPAAAGRHILGLARKAAAAAARDRAALPVSSGPALAEVSLWERGRLRGSAVSDGASAAAAIESAAARAVFDDPLRPVTAGELSRLRIAAAVSRGDFAPASGRLDPSRSYRLTTGSKRGWAFAYRRTADRL
ncbi:MAG: hypothetical protein HY925_15690, partial [Elusimicrobia bacterium]|nr:hypothetical protein [Elusimicrobiota bacterium]